MDNRSAGRKPDKSPLRTAASEDAQLGPRSSDGISDTRAAVTIKLGRPRAGEKRAKPWLDCKPPISKTTYWRRQKEAKK